MKCRESSTLLTTDERGRFVRARSLRKANPAGLLGEMTRSGRLPPTRTVLTGTGAAPETLEQARTDGAVAYVDKAIGPDEMARAVVWEILAPRLRATA